ncbi:heparan-alpha-glucosaminide N-acetyltransferase domain-containing protein [Microbacterium sp. 18062]|uniref:heparan-alpha-glucosaminide N-acetyltransferase domain-containing protein n=1 Tax=Microbacterium sp. 18062 TaxID=2681410 RepID=UPI00135C31C7|nr:heparan-alpha-glucosaminide N-acetyltransferase domain-containing protein [Microbacterium sp. 18062]
MRANVARLDGGGRIPGVDLARGLAVIGMLAAHLVTTESFSLARSETWTDVVNGRSSILFAVLAGVSIALTTGATRPIDGAPLSRARGRLAVRAGGLWVLGILLILTGVPVYVILPAYAILFLIAIPLLRLRAATLFVIAAALLVVMPFVQAALGLLPFWHTEAGESIGLVIGWPYPFPLWAGFVVLGLAIGRIDLRDPGVAALLLVTGGGIALVAYGIGGLLAPPGPVFEPVDVAGIVASVLPHSGGLPEVVGGAGFAAAVLGAAVLLCRVRPVLLVLLPLRATGSMPLTAYTAQVAIWAVWAFAALGTTGDLLAFRELHPFWPITLAVVVGCTLWTVVVGRGPLEAGLGALSRRVVRGSPPDARSPRA